MNNLKKIGLTALATTLVASSVFAGEMSVNGMLASLCNTLQMEMVQMLEKNSKWATN